MSESELMVGDWVKLLPPPTDWKQPSQLFQIREPMDLELAFRCEPIVLTSAILKKFDFIEEYRRMRMHYRVKNCQFVIEVVPPREMSVFMNEEFAGNFEILYVHELQHLLKLLKIEKYITL